MLKKRAIFLGGYALFLCAWFWTQSRYPALNMKAVMGDRSGVSTLSFDIWYPIFAGDSWALRILKSTVNWYYTNWKGMTFGLLFSGALLALLPLLRFRGFRSPWMNAFGGMATGAPLGVCANCVAPISLSAHRAGMRLEWSLAALFSSPTLNVVAVGMSFSMFPPLFAVLKLTLLAVLLFVLVPWIAKLGPAPAKPADSGWAPLPAGAKQEGWLAAAGGAVKDVVFSTGRIVWLAVPLMLLAGFLGATVAELLPIDALQGITVSLPLVALTALVGTLLPVPMTFDIVMTAILVGAGLPGAYAMALLFTLGTFSVYPFLLLWTKVSRPVALASFASVAVLGFAGGLAADRVLASRLERVAGLALNFDSIARESAVQATQEHCGLLAGEAENDCKFRVATESRLDFLCEGLPARTTTRCRGVVAGISTLQDPEGCMKVGDPLEREACVKHVFAGYAAGKIHSKFRAGFTGFCRRHKGEFSVACRDSLRAGRESRVGSLDACEAKPPEARSSCRDRVFLSRAMEDGDSAACAQIKSSELRAECGSRIANLWLPEQIKDSAQCMKLETERRPACLAQLASAKIAREFAAMLLRATPAASEEIMPAARTGGKAAALQPASVRQLTGAELLAFPHRARSGEEKKLFRKIEGPMSGIRLPPISVIELASYDARFGRGVAAGDFNRDGWIDLVFATPAGPAIFRNLGSGAFSHEPWSLAVGQEKMAPALRESQIVALVDINNDLFPDLFFSSNGGQAGFLVSNAGSFEASSPLLIEGATKSLTRAAGFFDQDRDGNLDVFFGNWTSGSATYQKQESENRLFSNKAGRFLPSPAYKDSVFGETLSVLASDVNQDGNADLFVANDYGPADEIYFGAANGSLRRLTDGQVIPYVSRANMSWDSADVNNDLRLDLFTVDIDFTFTGGLQASYCSFIETKVERDDCEDSLRAAAASNSMSVDGCLGLASASKRVSCLGNIMIALTGSRADPARCESFSATYPELGRLCLLRTRFTNRSLARASTDHVPQQPRNVLLLQGADGRFSAKEKDFGLDKSSWAWTAKFADLDEDGWQDLYVATGADKFDNANHSFSFFNEGGKKFRRGGAESGLELDFNSSSFVYADLDRDGDLDIVSNAVFGPAMIFMNESKGASLTVSLENRGRTVIGTRAVLEDELGRKQLRELKASGGYLSFDPAEMHFGLGGARSARSLRIFWPDGGSTQISGPLAAGHHYVVKRK